MAERCGFIWEGDCPDRMQFAHHLCSKDAGHSSRRHQCSCGALHVTPPPTDLLTDHPNEWDQ